MGCWPSGARGGTVCAGAVQPRAGRVWVSGSPGVRTLESEFLAVERFGEDPPLVAVEEKGYSESGAVDVERGVVQAYDRLQEANAAFAVAPTPAVSESAWTLARKLNVGVLGVDSDGGVSALEVPRVVGNRMSDEASAIRFQATAQGVANKSFSLNHPKNYLAYPLAVVHDRETDDILAERVVKAVDGARTGAAFFGLVEEQPHRIRVTPLGQEVVRFALDEYGSVDDALSVFEDWQARRQRVVDLSPRWGRWRGASSGSTPRRSSSYRNCRNYTTTASPTPH